MAPNIGWGGQLAGARVALHQAVKDRERADRRISYLLLILFVAAPFIQSVFLALAYFSLVAGAFLFVLIFGLLWLLSPSFTQGIINRRLLRRMSRHFDRETRMRAALIEYLHAKAAADGKLDKVAGSLLVMARLHGEAWVADRGRSVLWAFAVALPVVRYYFFWFISRFPNEHEQRWIRFMGQAEVACGELGVPFRMPPVKPIKKHNFWLFTLLSIITYEYFLVFWVFLLIREGNQHFDTHIQVDDALVLAFH